MGYFKNIIDRVKETYTRIKNYLTQPLHDRTGRVVGNRITIFGRDIQNRIVQTIYQMSVNRISMVVIFHLTAFVRNMYEK
tara:strand:+ start:1769 stop:2008 length:240 start_codon:yes stop_codon:yes gene_type:complete